MALSIKQRLDLENAIKSAEASGNGDEIAAAKKALADALNPPSEEKAKPDAED